MPTSQAHMENLLKDQWRSGSKVLDLHGCLSAYTAGEMQQLCSLITKAHPDVKWLLMWNNALDDAQAAAVPEALERLPRLERLELQANKFGGEAAAKIFIAAERHCLHLDELFMPEHCDPNTVDWAQLGVTMSPDVLAAAKNKGLNWEWGPMVKKQREMQAAGLVAPLPTVAAGVDQAKQAEEASLSELLLGVGVKPNKVDQVLKALEDNDIDDADDLKHLAPADVKDLGLSVLHTTLVTKLLSNLKMGGAGGAGAGAGGGAGAGAGAGAHPQVGGSGEVPGVPAGKRFHVFLTHDWGEDDKGRNNHVRATRLNEWLKARGVSTWFDSDKMQGNVVQQMCDGIDASAAVLVLVTKRYVDKVGGTNHADNCKKEFMYADRQKTSSQMLPVVMEQRMKDSRQWGGPVGMSLGGQLYQKLWDDSTFDQDAEGVLAGLVKMLLSP